MKEKKKLYQGKSSDWCGDGVSLDQMSEEGGRPRAYTVKYVSLVLFILSQELNKGQVETL